MDTRQKLKRGAAEFILVAIIAAAAIIGSRVYGRPDRPRVDRRYRAPVETTMASVAEALNLEWQTRRIGVGILPGERKNAAGYWEKYIAGGPKPGWKAGFSQPGRATVIVDPETKHLPSGIWSVLGHELAHVLLWQNGTPGDEHHGRMRAAGILWAQL